MVLHQRAHGFLGRLLRLPQARGALPGGDLQHPPPSEASILLVKFPIFFIIVIAPSM